MIGLRRRVNLRLRIYPGLIKHLKPVLILFANTLATTIYVSSDILILGLISSDYTVGIYTISSKIYSVIKQVLAAIIIVSVPRLSFLFGKNEMPAFNHVASNILNAISLITIPAAVGIFSLRKEIILFISPDPLSIKTINHLYLLLKYNHSPL